MENYCFFKYYSDCLLASFFCFDGHIPVIPYLTFIISRIVYNDCITFSQKDLSGIHKINPRCISSVGLLIIATGFPVHLIFLQIRLRQQ